MERSVASLTYEGSVTEAIVEAQKKKKLFVVYISGDDENSTRLEQTTWVDDTVVECISKYCIFLHLMQGSIDSLQFAAIYPQKSVPSITAVGYNGVMSWQHEGYISGENFVGSIEKAWAALHFQETAVTLLTVALAPNKPEPVNSSSQHVVQRNTSALDITSTSEGNSTKHLENTISDDSKLLEEKMVTEPTDDKKITVHVPETSQSGIFDDVKIKGEEETSSENTTREVLYTVTGNVHNPSTCNDDVSTAPKETHALGKSCAEASPVSVDKPAVCGPHSSQITITEKKENRKNEEVAEPSDCSNSTKSEHIFLNIRLPNGASLQRKFTVRDTLNCVKDYVDENQVNGVGSYDLAVPYPRRVFNEQDMNCFLSELGFAARQALIVVPHRQPARPQSGMPSSHDNQNAARSMDNSTDDNGGYFAFVKRVLSYVSPFSYLGGNANSSNPEPAPSHGYQQYRPNHTFQSRQFSGSEASSRPLGMNQQNPLESENAGETRRRTSRPFGSNIHTLRHDEDDFETRDRNTFWNGNSTQFGGDDKK